jgi:hypothetical protein
MCDGRLCADTCYFEDLTRWCVDDVGQSSINFVYYFKVVDIFDANAGTWYTAQLSVARSSISATSLPSQGLAVFAGGEGALLRNGMS